MRKSRMGLIVAVLASTILGASILTGTIRADLPPQARDPTPYVPFKTVSAGLPAVCDAAGGIGTVGTLTINGVLGVPFMVTGVLLEVTGVDAVSDNLQVVQLLVDGTFFQAVTTDLTGDTTAFRGFDLAGAPAQGGANLPTSIVSLSSVVPNDILYLILCSAGVATDMSIVSIVVSRWRTLTDTISVTFVPG